MSRALLVYLLLILLPGAVLAWLALGVVEQETREAYRRLDGRLEDEADSRRRRFEEEIVARLEEARREIAAAVADPRSPAVVGFDRGDGALRYCLVDPDEAPDEADVEAPSDEELHFFELSRAGGESYEFERGDPYRALDAYSFYLPRIRSKTLRARLRFRSARAAGSAGEGAVARRIYRELFREAAGTLTEDGFPVDVLAAARLLEDAGELDAELSAQLVERLDERQRFLPTGLLGHLVDRLVAPEARGAFPLEERSRLERRVREYARRGDRRAVILEGDELLVVHDVDGVGKDRGAASAVRAFRLISRPFSALRSSGPGLVSRRLDGDAPPVLQGEGFVVSPVRAGLDGAVVTHIRVSDPDYSAELASIARRRGVATLLVAFMIVVSAGGGLFLVRGLRRERRLAELRARLITNVSHELKTPVTSLRMFSEMLAEDPLDEARTRRFAELLRGESIRLTQLIDNLLDFSRLGRKDTRLELELVDVGAILDETAGSFRIRARESGVDFGLDVEAAAGSLCARANRMALERITLNLLDNALKYGKSAKPAIRLQARARNGQVEISVEDNGPGIPPSERERIFEEFHRLHYDDYAVRGSGLGLSLSRRLARKMGGDVEVSSRTGKGSRFTLRLPIAAESSPESSGEREEGKE
ncbi:MAG: HAMP domain-containing sensor histidine kinase [Planctomycetota bacterium]|nr:HAMP domain-containing sensor histidine kinase [Planctomycetota bacterium]